MHGWDALYIFMLAAFAGYEVIGRVPVILHTPLMSGSNFIHGIVVVGSMVALGAADTNAQRAIGFVGVLLGAANAVGGYAVTDRMLEMFKSSREMKTGDKGAEAGGAAKAAQAGDGAPAPGAGPAAGEPAQTAVAQTPPPPAEGEPRD
jgi:H+-translocating NAD(P) transhydrogenase subunit alpha